MKDEDLIDSSKDDEELFHLMKTRIIESYRWQEDILKPVAKELDITEEEFKEILIKRLDMSSLEAIHPRFESSKHSCIKERIHADLRFCWLSDVMNLLSPEETEEIKNKLAGEILKEDKSYDEAIEEGRRELLEYLKR